MKKIGNKNTDKLNNNGITLIALIITIIVMLILVAVTINLAVNGGLFGYAGNAVKDTKTALRDEQKLGKVSSNMTVDELIAKYTGDTSAEDLSNLQEFFNKTLVNIFDYDEVNDTFSFLPNIEPIPDANESITIIDMSAADPPEYILIKYNNHYYILTDGSWTDPFTVRPTTDLENLCLYYYNGIEDAISEDDFYFLLPEPYGATHVYIKYHNKFFKIEYWKSYHIATNEDIRNIEELEVTGNIGECSLSDGQHIFIAKDGKISYNYWNEDDCFTFDGDDGYHYSYDANGNFVKKEVCPGHQI